MSPSKLWYRNNRGLVGYGLFLAFLLVLVLVVCL